MAASDLVKGPAAALERVKAIGRPEQTNEVRNLARNLLDEEYFSILATRLKAGLLAPGVEVMLWRYAFGEPKADMAEKAQEVARFEAIREEVRQRIREGRTSLIDAQAQGAKRVLRLAPQPSMPDEDGTDGP